MAEKRNLPNFCTQCLQTNQMFRANNGDRDDADNYIIVLTDGESNEREADTIPEAIDARVAGATVISIGIGTAVNQLELRGETSLCVAAKNTVQCVSIRQ